MKKYLKVLISLCLFGVALYVLAHTLKGFHWHDAAAFLTALPASHIGMALLATLLSYVLLSGYDALSLRYIGKRIAWPHILVTSFVAYAFSMNMGFALFTGGAVRYRLYSAWGLNTVDIAKISAFCAVTLFLGVSLIGGGGLIALPDNVLTAAGFTGDGLQWLGGGLLLLAGFYLALQGWWKRPLVVWGESFRPPGIKLAAAQALLSIADWSVAALVLMLLLPDGLSHWPLLLAAFALAQIIGLVSHVPGGVGIFESVMLLVLTPFMPVGAIVGALLAYRLIYYLLPFVIALVGLAGYELYRQYMHKVEVRRQVSVALQAFVPLYLATAVFVSGLILLVSGALPAEQGRMDILRDLLPLPVVELSHMAGSAIGAILLILGRGIQRRYNGAYWLSLILLAAGAIVSVTKGVDYEEACFLSLTFLMLLPCRAYFYRHSSLLSLSFTPGWLAAVSTIFIGSLWLGLFAYRHVDYADTLWWKFAFHADAPRFLRASVAAALMIILFALVRLMRPVMSKPGLSPQADWQSIDAIVAQSPDSGANLAYTGDKQFLFSPQRDAFIMFARQGRSCIAMGDPVGNTRAFPELVSAYIDMCDRYDLWPVFYQVGKQWLDLYVQTGLTLLKLGEEAGIELATFSLKGAENARLRQMLNKGVRHGLSFSILPASEIDTLLPDLGKISREWMAEKGGDEKGFSLGRFDADYLRHFPVAVVRMEGRIVAFANLWPANGEEFSIDLMRQTGDCPNGTMDYLFVQLLTWGQAQGFAWFNMGMAPLSGTEASAKWSQWAKLSDIAYEHGNFLYNFKGLRQYKEKFRPHWRARFLVAPGGLTLPRVVIDLARLINMEA
ncbi:bifunctional lysylphosphatidylglycerol flippase/synthetase MprF [Mariprofundus ferrooxydans]|uniref:bifunctional lysylphosphatidylglycerol flippase/synthetase MprF n=1 Tax=Mariprofundus ferrooxydans TaxID=314344 RepID=UPI00142FB610|nr:bifunctional lysylphosphatidylglycerol flippase/synthetase MprF [Mariprofundus ferrooxydans]